MINTSIRGNILDTSDTQFIRLRVPPQGIRY